MVARGRWRTRLAAGGAGLAINAGLLALLTLERRTPPMVEPQTVVIALESREAQPERRTAPAPRVGAPSPARLARETPPSSVEALILPTAPSGPNLSDTVEPGWRVGAGEYLDPVTARRARQAWEKAENSRFQRACLGQSEEHMTEEEKLACWDSWQGDAPITGWAPQRPGRPWPGLPGEPKRAIPPRKGSLQKIRPQTVRPESPIPRPGTPPG